MARVNTKKERTQKETTPSTKSRAKKEKSSPRSDVQLQEQISALGGNSEDVELLKDVQNDGQLEIGDQGHDVGLL